MSRKIGHHKNGRRMNISYRQGTRREADTYTFVFVYYIITAVGNQPHAQVMTYTVVAHEENIPNVRHTINHAGNKIEALEERFLAGPLAKQKQPMFLD